MASLQIESIDTSPPTSDDTLAPAAATLLLVDDEPSILSSLRRLFRPKRQRGNFTGAKDKY